MEVLKKKLERIFLLQAENFKQNILHLLSS